MSRLLTPLVVLAIAFTASADAQTRPQPRGRQPARPVAPKPRVGFGGYVTFGATTLAAKETFDAVAESRAPTLTVGGQVTNIWKSVFADVGVSNLSVDGERVFVLNGRVFQLGIPLEITVRTLDVSGGWRLSLWRNRLVPYAGAGISRLRYEETSEFAQSGEDVSESRVGPLLMAGAQVRVWRWVSAGGEIRWRRVRGILGDAGVSAELDEDDAGGLSAGFRIFVGR